MYEHGSGNVREISLPLPETTEAAEAGVVVEIAEFSDKVIDSRRVAPDGYELVEPGRGGSGLLGLFYRGRRRGLAIGKSGAVVAVPSGNGFNPYGARFLGWIVAPPDHQNTMTAKQQALKQIADHGARTRRDGGRDRGGTVRLGERSRFEIVAADAALRLLGRNFVLAGLGVFIEMQWATMNSMARITVTLGSGIAMFVMALFAAGDERWEKTATPLFLLAALLQPTGILVAIAEFSKGGDERHAILLTAGVLLIQAGADFSQNQAHGSAVYDSRLRSVSVRNRLGPHRSG